MTDTRTSGANGPRPPERLDRTLTDRDARNGGTDR